MKTKHLLILCGISMFICTLPINIALIFGLLNAQNIDNIMTISTVSDVFTALIFGATVYYLDKREAHETNK